MDRRRRYFLYNSSVVHLKSHKLRSLVKSRLEKSGWVTELSLVNGAGI
jgi:hypothetical protein